MRSANSSLLVEVPQTDKRIRVAVVSDNMKEREKLSETVGESLRFQLVCSVSSRHAQKSIPLEATDLIIGHASDEKGFEKFLDVANVLEDIPSLLFVSGFDELGSRTQHSAINSLAEITDLSDRKMGLHLNSIEKQATVHGVPKSLVRERDEKLLSGLTDREREVLVLTANGLSIKEIARELSRSYGTIASHRASLMEKTGIHDKVGLARFAIRTRLIAA